MTRSDENGARPLPNDVLHAGDLCPKSFARSDGPHIEPAGKGWGACSDCGEVLNTRGEFLAEHLIPGGTNA